jgi:transposase
MMGNARFSDEFKRDAVRQITERGYPVRRFRSGWGQSAFALRVAEEVLEAVRVR